MKLYAPETVREIKNLHGFKLSKCLGQNFLTDKAMIDKIIDESFIEEDDLVIEIGPGMGVLTCEAAKYARHVIAVEIDEGLIPVLNHTLKEYDNIEIVNGDILKTDMSRLIHEARQKDPGLGSVKIIGNLPYYITTPIIMKILEEAVPADSITIMMQKEVAARINAHPSTKAYGALTVAVRYYCNVYHVIDVPKEVFVPQPKVDSSVLRLEIRDEKPVDLLDEKNFFICIRGGFNQRRKTLLNSLTGISGMDREQVKKMLDSVGIEPTRRAETLTIEEFANIANRVTMINRSNENEV